MAWEEISDVFHEAGKAKLAVGQVLMFDFEGSRTELKIMRLVNGKVWARQVHTHHPDEVKGRAAVMRTASGHDVTVGEVVEKLKEDDRA